MPWLFVGFNYLFVSTCFLVLLQTMALRSVIGKLRTTGKSIHNYTRLIGTPAMNNKEVISIAPSSYSSSGHPFGFGSYESRISKPKSTKHQVYDSIVWTFFFNFFLFF